MTRNNGILGLLENEEHRVCRVCGRTQVRQMGHVGLKCLYCTGPLYPRGFKAAFRGFNYPCPGILRHHLMKECPTCRNLNGIWLYADSQKAANRTFAEIVAFTLRNPRKGNILRRFGAFKAQNGLSH